MSSFSLQLVLRNTSPSLEPKYKRNHFATFQLQSSTELEPEFQTNLNFSLDDEFIKIINSCPSKISFNRIQRVKAESTQKKQQQQVTVVSPKGMRRLADLMPLEDVIGITEEDKVVLRPKTPPQPHHYDDSITHYLSILQGKSHPYDDEKQSPSPHHFSRPSSGKTVAVQKQRADKKKERDGAKTVEVAVEIASVDVDLRELFLGKTCIATCDDWYVEISASGLLLDKFIRWTPILIQIQRVSPMPQKPISADKLSNECKGVYCVIEGAGLKSFTEIVDYGSSIRFKKQHLFFVEKKTNDLRICIHDRDPKVETANPVHYGEAIIALDALKNRPDKSKLELNVTPHIFPKGTIVGTTGASCFAASWIEAGTEVTITIEKLEPQHTLWKETKEGKKANFVQFVLISKYGKNVVAEFDKWNVETLNYDVSEYRLSKEERLDISLDLLSGYCICDSTLNVYFLECLTSSLPKAWNLKNFGDMRILNTSLLREWINVDPRIQSIAIPKAESLLKNAHSFTRTAPRISLIALQKLYRVLKENELSIFTRAEIESLRFWSLKSSTISDIRQNEIAQPKLTQTIAYEAKGTKCWNDSYSRAVSKKIIPLYRLNYRQRPRSKSCATFNYSVQSENSLKDTFRPLKNYLDATKRISTIGKNSIAFNASYMHI